VIKLLNSIFGTSKPPVSSFLPRSRYAQLLEKTQQYADTSYSCFEPMQYLALAYILLKTKEIKSNHPLRQWNRSP